MRNNSFSTRHLCAVLFLCVGAAIPNAVTTRAGFVDPIYYWDPVIAPSGAQFYSGDAFPAWRGSLFVGALKEMRLVRLVIENDDRTFALCDVLRLSERIGRAVSDDNVRFLVDDKLRPAGLVKDAKGRDPGQQRVAQQRRERLLVPGGGGQ